MADNEQTVKKYAINPIPVDKCIFQWRIEKNPKCIPGESVRTEDFYLEPDCKWYAEISLGISQFFYLCRYANQSEIKVDYTISISNTAEKILHTETSSHCFTQLSKWKNLINTIFIEDKKAVDNVLVFTLHLNRYKHAANKWMTTFSSQKELHTERLETLSDDFKNLYTNMIDTDVILKFQDEGTLSANKAVLCARSAVFAKMFQQKMTEQEDNVVCIDDISMSVMKHAVAFMYCGQVEEYDFDMAFKLYYAADKYELLDLRKHCGYILAARLTMENAPKVLYLADQHIDSTLKKAVIQFIRETGEKEMISNEDFVI